MYLTIKNKRGKTFPPPAHDFLPTPSPTPSAVPATAGSLSSNAYFVFVSLREETKTAAGEGD